MCLINTLPRLKDRSFLKILLKVKSNSLLDLQNWSEVISKQIHQNYLKQLPPWLKRQSKEFNQVLVAAAKKKKSSTKKKLPRRLTDPFKKTKSDSGASDLPKKTFLASSQIHENQEASDVFDMYLDRIEPTHTRQKSTYSLHFKGNADSNQIPEEAEDPQEPDVFDQYLDKIETWW